MYIHFARGEKTKTQMKATFLHEALEWPSRWHTLCVWSESKNVEEKKKSEARMVNGLTHTEKKCNPGDQAPHQHPGNLCKGTHEHPS